MTTCLSQYLDWLESLEQSRSSIIDEAMSETAVDDNKEEFDIVPDYKTLFAEFKQIVKRSN